MALASNRAFLELTCLEERCCPTASVFAQSGVLYITTDVSSDTVQIRDNGQGQMAVTVRDGEGIQRLNASGINQIVLQLNGAHDWVDIYSTSPLEHPLNLKVDLAQSASDRVFVELNQGLDKGSLSVNLFGTLGDSTVDTTVGPLGHGTVDFQEHLTDAYALSSVHIEGLPNQLERIYVGL